MKRDRRAEAAFPLLKDLADFIEEMERLTGKPLEPIAETIYEQDVTCPLCGGREIRATRNPDAPGAVMAVCSKCSEA